VRVIPSVGVAVAILGLAAQGLALDPRQGIDEYVRETWEMQQGLPQSSVMAVLQTRDAYLWVGTHGGLARFDGVGFTSFLKDQHVHALLEDRDGTLWIGSWGDGITRYRGGQLAAFTTNDGLVHDEVRCFLQTRDGALWIGTNGGLSRFEKGSFTNYTPAHGLPHAVVRALHEDRAGVLWIATHGGGLSSFEGGRFTHHTRPPELRADEVIRALLPTPEGGLWLGTSRGLKRLDRGKVQSYTQQDGLSDDDVVALHYDRDGQLWIGTRLGLSRFHGGRFEKAAPSSGLGEAEVRAFGEDREGGLWVGTYDGGLQRLNDRAFQTLTKAFGLSEDNVRAVYEARDGALWIGTHSAGINRVKDGHIRVFTRAHGLPSERVWTAAEDAAGTLWVGTFGGGLARYSGGRFHPFTAKEGLPSDTVRCLLAGRDGVLWIGTEHGLARLRGGRIERFGETEELRQPEVLALHEAADGTLWIGTRGGLYRLRHGVLDVPPGGADLGIVLAIREDPDGTLWVGTRGRGLWRGKDGRWETYTTAAGLPDDSVLHILEDDDGHLWLSSPRGIFRVARRDLMDPRSPSRSGVVYDRGDGMDSVECNGGFQPAGWRTRDGRLWFPTMKGVAVIDPRRRPINNVPPPIHIEAIRMSGRPAPLEAPLEFAPDSKSLEISYVGLSLVAPEKVRFRYKLDGFDEDWVTAGPRRTAYYSTLPPGRYRFRVAACNNSGYWSDAEAAVAFVVRPWFYQTWWFYTAVGAALALLIAAEHRLRMRRARRRFAAILDERIRIARELHDTMAQGLAVVGLQLEALSARLPIAPDAAALRHLDNARTQVRTSLVEAKQSVWDLRSPRLDQRDLRGALAALAEEVRATGKVQADFRFEGRPRALPEDVKGHLLRIAQEAVSNALKHAAARRIEVRLHLDADGVRLAVADDGRGIDSGAPLSSAQFGLAGMRERARLMNAELTVERRSEGGTEVAVSLSSISTRKEHRLWTLVRAIRRRATPTP
jgi:ligand-binding sensor domain-containing protein/signal transduction histidine kinase